MKRIMILVLAAVMGGQLCARTNYSWSDVNNAYEGNGSTNVTFNGTIFRFDPNGALYLSVHGSGRLTFKARGSYDGFSYVYNEGATSRYIRNSDEFATYTIDIANEGWHAVLWHTYPAGYIVASAWGEVKDICWNDEPIPYSDTAVKNGLVARYGLDGYLIDESGHGYTLHSNKAESYVDDRFGKADSAYWLDGSTTLFESETTESVRWEANFTYMYWFKVSEETALYDVKSSGIWGMSSSIKYIIGQTDIPLAIGTNGINVFEHGPSFLPAVFRYDADIGTAWHHIAVSLSNNQEVKVYLDGVMIGSFAKQRQSNVASLGLGQYDSGAAQRYTGIGTFGYGGRFRGGVDEARFYNRPLSAAEVKAVYDSERGATLYVNGTTGSDENPGTSPETAKKTIQSAIDVSVDGDTILVAPGTYDKFTSSNNCIRVESSDGPLSTIIDGHGVYTEANIMRLSGGIAGGTNTFVVGFTIQHLTRIDGGTIRRCIVRDNDTSTVGCGTFSGSVAENCLIINNRGMNGAVADASILRNCTMVGNSASAVYDGVCLNSVLENCIVYGNANNERQTWQYWFERSWLANWDHREIKVFDSDPKFVNAENGDYHLFEDSDCIDFGDNRYVFTDKDLDGNVRIGNGVVDIGCYESLIPPIWTVSFDACGGVASKDTMSVTNNTAIGELPTAELFGYDLLGWFTAAVGGTQVTPETIITNNVTFYAHWEKADLGVDYVLGGHWTSGTTASGEGLVFAGLDETAEGGLSVRLKSEDDCETWIETTVTGEMWVSFDWKTSCETFEYLELDRIEFSIDGHRQAWANGETDWTNRTFAVRGEGEHTIRFAYVKDESEFSGDDSVWVANVATTPKTAVATPVIDLPATYATESTTCAITTETEGATIRYKLDYYGDESEWFEYAGPFEITGSKTVVAYATKRNYYDSETVRASCERTMPWTLAECVNAPHLDFATGGDGEWKRTTATTHDGVAAVRSGEIATGEQSWFKVQMLGPGTISFWWKADSAYYKKTLLDYATFKVDGKEVAKIGGAADWVRVAHEVTGTGLHTYLWTYTKTAQTAMGEDCVWLDEVTWTPNTTGGVVVPTTVTGGKAVTVGTDWKDVELDEKFGGGTRTKFEKRYGADLTAALLKPSGKCDVHGNVRYVWQDNVMGTDPTDKASELVTSVEVVDGVPVVTWEPDLGAARAYKIWGSENLSDWQWPTNDLHRFFKVTVEMGE